MHLLIKRKIAVALAGLFFFMTFGWNALFILWIRAPIPGNESILMLYAGLMMFSCTLVPLLCLHNSQIKGMSKAYMPFFGIVLLFFLPLLAFKTGFGVFWTWGVYLATCSFGLKFLSRTIIKFPLWYVIPLFLGSFGTAVCFQALLNTQIFHVLTPEAILLGAGYHDPLFHISISSMIKNYGVPSLGIDGLEEIRYHYGAHTWFAAISKATGVNLIRVYPLTVLALMYSMLFFSLTLMILLCFRSSFKNTWACIFSPILLTIPYHFFGYHTHRVVETYIISLIPLCCGVGMLACCDKSKRNNTIDKHFIIYVFSLSLTAFLVCMTKVSSGFILFVGAFFFWWLVWGIGKRLYFGGIMLSAVAATGFFLFTFTNHGIFASYNDKLQWVQCIYFAIEILLKHADWWSYIFYPGVAVSLLVYSFICKRKKKRDILFLVFNRQYSYGLLLFVISCAGIAAGLLTLRQDWLYFAQPGFWLSIPLLVVLFLSSNARYYLEDNPINVMFCSVLMLVVGVHLSMFFPVSEIGMVNNINVINDQLSNQNKVEAKPENMSGNWVIDSRKLAKRFAKSFRDTEYGRMYNMLSSYENQKDPIFVDPSNKFFWSHNVNYEFASPLYIPSVVGVPLLLGLPPAKLETTFSRRKEWWYSEQSRSRDISDYELLQYAKKRSFKGVVRFVGITDKTKNNILY